MKFIHTGDIHWGMTPDADKPWGSERAQAIKDTFKKIIAQAGKMQADCLFISGEEVDYYTEVTGGDLKEGDQLIYDNTFSVTEGQVFTPEQIYSNQALDTEGMMSTEAE